MLLLWLRSELLIQILPTVTGTDTSDTFSSIATRFSSVFCVVFHCPNLNMNWISPSSLNCHPAYNLFRMFCFGFWRVFKAAPGFTMGWCYNAVGVECDPFWIYSLLLFPLKRGCACCFNYPERHRNHSFFHLFPEKWLSFGYCEILKFLSLCFYDNPEVYGN